jgi:hypothetical protein
MTLSFILFRHYAETVQDTMELMESDADFGEVGKTKSDFLAVFLYTNHCPDWCKGIL